MSRLRLVLLGLAVCGGCASGEGPSKTNEDSGEFPADSAEETGAPETGDSALDSGGDSGDDTAQDTGPDPATLDQDGDGFTPNGGDCDDERAHVYPGAPDYCDGLDADCDGEPIPDGSCSEVGDPRLMWTWSLEGTTGSYGYLTHSAGDIDGDGREDVLVSGVEGSDRRSGTLPGAGMEAWPARGPAFVLRWSDNFPQWVMSGPLAGGDVNADGYDDVWVPTSSSAGYTGGAFLMLGREGGFGDVLKVVDDAADAMWLDSAGPELNNPVGSGELNGDEYADMLLQTYADGNDTLWSIIPGQTLPTGNHSVASLSAIHADLEGNEILGGGAVFRDLDGDGVDEIGAMSRRDHDGDSVIMFLEGEALQDGAWLVDVGTDAWLSDAGDVNIGWNSTVLGSSDDVDGDGLNDVFLTLRTGSGADTTYCVALFSGAVPSGDMSDLRTVSVCAVDDDSLEVAAWQGDVDADGVRDVQVDGERGWITIPSTRLRDGGVQGIDEIAGPTTYWGTYFRTTADFNGDGLPEWVYADNEWEDPEVEDAFVRSLVLTGFEIPWDDPSKW